MRYFLGVDAGATKTHALLGDEIGRILSMGRGGPGNHQAPGGVDRAMGCIAEAVEAACRIAAVETEALAHAAFCLAGADLPSDYELLGNAIQDRWPRLNFSVHNDSFAGLRAGAPRGWGVVSICGTGTNQAGIGKNGRALQVGGLGGVFGDYGGGADLGRESVKAVFLADEQRGPDTLLKTSVLETLGVGSVDELREALYLGKIDRSLIFQLAPHVFAAANRGDRVSQEILIRMGTAMGDSVGGVIRQLSLEGEMVDVVLAGSTWKGESPLLLDAFRMSVHRVAPFARLIRPRYEPVVGAWLLALEQSGATPSVEVYKALERTLPPELPILEEGQILTREAGQGGLS